MNYQVGIDLGTTFTAAAVCRQDDQTQIEVVPLGSRGAAVPSVVFVAEDESLVIGEAATRRALTDPHRVVREFKRRIGDATPLVVGGKPLEPQALAAKFVRWVVDRVAEREGGSATGIAVTHPAAWGPHKQELLAKALAHEGLADATLVSEPTAAAVAYAHAQHMEPDATVGVYDLGGGTFDAAIVRKLPEAEFEPFRRHRASWWNRFRPACVRACALERGGGVGRVGYLGSSDSLSGGKVAAGVQRRQRGSVGRYRGSNPRSIAWAEYAGSAGTFGI